MKNKMEYVVNDIATYTDNAGLQDMIRVMFDTLLYCRSYLENMEETNKSKDNTLRHIEDELKIIDSYIYTEWV